MTNVEITRGLLRLRNILNTNKARDKYDYERIIQSARESANTMLAMLDEPAAPTVGYDYASGPDKSAGTFVVLDATVGSPEELTKLVIDTLKSFGIGEKEPEQKRCGNCGTSSHDGMNTYLCIHPEALKIIPSGSWTLPFQTCGLWTPLKEAANA